MNDYDLRNFMAGFNFGNVKGTSVAASPFTDAILQLNGNDRFSIREATYFSRVQPFQHHTNIPSNPGIHVYSFARQTISRNEDRSALLDQAFIPCRAPIWQRKVRLSLSRSARPNTFTLISKLP